MLILYMKSFNRLKHMEKVADIFVIPRNMPFAVLRSPLLIHIRFSNAIYSISFYKYSLFICSKSILNNLSAYKFIW